MIKLLYSFRESSEFEKKIVEFLTDEEYSRLQWALMEQPNRGDLIRGSGGLRKLRWAARGKGKSGGLRIIYYWADSRGYIYMINVYAKSKQEDLTAEQLKTAREIVEGWKNEA